MNKTVKILYVEDDFFMQKSMHDILKAKYGVNNVFTASDGSEALKVYNDISPDIVITDIKMAPKDGIFLIESIRETNKKVPIIVMSAYERESYKLDTIEICEYLVKPVPRFTLLYTIEHCLYGT